MLDYYRSLSTPALREEREITSQVVLCAAFHANRATSRHERREHRSLVRATLRELRLIDRLLGRRGLGFARPGGAA